MHSLSKNELAIRRMHPVERHFFDETILQVAWHPSEDLAGLITSDGKLHLVTSASLKQTRSVPAHEQGALFLAWSPAGDVIATSGQDGMVRLWSVAELDLLHEFRISNQWIDLLSWASPTRLAAATGRQVFVIDIDVQNATEITVGDNTVTGLAWRDESQLVLTTYGRALAVNVNDKDGAVLTRFDYPEAMLKMALSPDGSFAAIGCQDAAARVWAIDQTNDALQMSGYQEKVQVLSWSGSGNWLALSGGTHINVWGFGGNGPKETKPLELIGHQTVVTAAAFATNGTKIASADKGGMLCFWDVDSFKGIPSSIGLNKSAIHSLAWNFSNEYLLTGDQDGSVALWRTDAAYR